MSSTSTSSTTSVNITERVQDGSVPWMIIIACIVIALLGFVIGMLWLRARKRRHAQGHLDAHIARPESLKDSQGSERRP